MTDLQLAFNKRNALFIEARTKTQQEIERFFESIKDVPAEVLEGIEIPADTRAEAIIPSMYLDPPDQEKYKAELENFKTLCHTILERIDNVNQEAMECLKQYM